MTRNDLLLFITEFRLQGFQVLPMSKMDSQPAELPEQVSSCSLKMDGGDAVIELEINL